MIGSMRNNNKEDYSNGLNNLTEDELEQLHEVDNLNHDQIPLDVLQMIENELNEREEDN